MLELEGVSSVLRDGPKMINVSKEKCSSMCIRDHECELCYILLLN